MSIKLENVCSSNVSLINEGTNEHENEPGSTSCEDESKQHEGGSASRQASEDPNNIGSSWLPAHNTRAQSKLSGDMSTPTQLNNQPSRGTPQAPRLSKAQSDLQLKIKSK